MMATQEFTVTCMGDREEDLSLRKRQHDQIEEILEAFSGVLEGADKTLTTLEDNVDLLPSAILRKCEEFADGISTLATRLEEHSPEQQRALAQALVQDYQDTLALQQNNDADVGDLGYESSSTMTVPVVNPSSPPSEEAFLNALQGASTVLRDVEAAFREITQTDAEDIADAALTLARLFLVSLQNVLQTLTPDDLLTMEQPRNTGSQVVIEEICDEDAQESSNVDKETSHNESESSGTSTASSRKKYVRRVRVLWPRLGPAVAQALDWGKDAASERPLLMVALGLTLWPAAIVTTVACGSIVLADHVVQDIYQHFQDGPFISNLEQAAAECLQAGKLGFVISTVVGKQTLRVVQRQVKRHGGLEQIVHSVKDVAVERITHPVETIGMAWNGLAWGFAAVSNTFQNIQQQREELIAAQALQ